MRKHLYLHALFFLAALTCSAQEIFNDCPMHGDALGARDQQTNRMKNRYSFPSAGDIDPAVTLEAMLAPGDDEGRFSEAMAAEITGYVVHVSLNRSKETCNCKATEPAFTDTHIEVAIDADHTGKSERVVVEVTPRLRAMMADRGVDWSSLALKEDLEGRTVTFTGWLLWDWRHTNAAENTDPGDARNWRATSWEIHPVTSFEVLDDPTILINADENDLLAPEVATSFPDRQGSGTAFNIQTQSASEMLTLILLGAMLGMSGQVLRLVVGLKKAKNEAIQNQKDGSISNLIQLKQLFLGLLIAVIIGAVAGILASLNMDGNNLSTASVVAILAAGYAGTDFIEGIAIK